VPKEVPLEAETRVPRVAADETVAPLANLEAAQIAAAAEADLQVEVLQVNGVVALPATEVEVLQARKVVAPVQPAEGVEAALPGARKVLPGVVHAVALQDQGLQVALVGLVVDREGLQVVLQGLEVAARSQEGPENPVQGVKVDPGPVAVQNPAPPEVEVQRAVLPGVQEL
jgi:hypothetical protein